MDAPETRYARSGDVNIAYQVSGTGPIDLVWVPGFVSNIELEFEYPEAQHFIHSPSYLMSREPTIRGRRPSPSAYK
jgi:hypothetical protein